MLSFLEYRMIAVTILRYSTDYFCNGRERGWSRFLHNEHNLRGSSLDTYNVGVYMCLPDKMQKLLVLVY